ERAGLGVSPATIRNDMAALEELGYLTHPHTSAGRIPTDLGYRRYVDTLPAGGRLGDAQRRALTGFFAQTMRDLEEVLKGTTLLLSRMTQSRGLAAPPRWARSRSSASSSSTWARPSWCSSWASTDGSRRRSSIARVTWTGRPWSRSSVAWAARFAGAPCRRRGPAP